MNDSKNIESLSFEKALSELQDIVRNIETGKDGLDKIINDYERGNALKKHCENKLAAAKLKVDKIIKKSEDDSVALEEGL
jgi:exodeoxyribonuclease VII small subunit